MTNDEISKACMKFSDYLIANGVEIYAQAIFSKNCVHFHGNSEMVDELMLRMHAHRLGFELHAL